MLSVIDIILIITAPVLWSVMIVISHFLDNRKMWIAVLSGILGGLCAGIGSKGFPDGLIDGVIIGMASLIVIPSGIITKHYQQTGRKMLKRYWGKQDV